ncbi:MAG: SRPBCC family protein [Acidimicrobiia bacterium]|nr:SRPBCC family protein [Acidimicrobiia bacterium]
MATTRQPIRSPLDAVFDVVANPRTYPRWLVGARDIGAVDAGWPAAGTQFHHRVGVAGPFTVADTTQCCRVERPTLLELEVRVRPFGRGRVVFTFADLGDGITEVVVDEVPIGSLRPFAPLLELPTALRNRRSLQRLAALIECEAVPPR